MNDLGTHAQDLRIWRNFVANPGFYTPRKHLIGPSTKVFTMGSCFALEVRRALQRNGIEAYPNYLSVRYSLSDNQFSSFTDTCEFQPHYDTFCIRQEFEMALGLWKDRRSGFIQYSGTKSNREKGWDTIYQDPFRKMTLARSSELLNGLSDQIDHVVTDGLLKADVIVITLGLTEVWRGLTSGKYFCQQPRGPNQAEFHASTFQENYENVRATFDMLFSRFPNKQIILSVSPVPLGSTSREMDIGTANTESKSILRAVAGQICSEYESNVTYFPSFEMANLLPRNKVYEDDLRHVRPEFANRVASGFLTNFSK